jgi:hypothetical protein
MALRNLPSKPLKPFINCRPVSTKYSWFPIVDLRRHVKYPLNDYPYFETEQTFYPGTSKAPFSGYEVNLESEFRNQIFALQSADQAVYVPKPSSDLYQPTIQFIENTQHLPTFNPNTLRSKTTGFNNSTRQDILNL